MTKKLLHKTSRAYLLFAVLIFSVSAPLAYLALKKIYTDDADEALLLRKEEFLVQYAGKLTEKDIQAWNAFNRDIKIFPGHQPAHDSLFQTYYADSLSNEYEPYRELRSPVVIEGKPYTLSIRTNLVESEDLLRSIALLFAGILAFFAVGFYLISSIYSVNIWKPFNDVLLQLERFEIDKALQPNFAPTGIEEFLRLQQSVEKLIQKNTAIYKLQNEFIENAAHELQTPLAVAQGRLETLLQSGEFSEEQYNIIHNLNENLTRLIRLNKNLLLLSKIENDAYVETSKITLNELIGRQLKFFEEQAGPKNISIATTLESGPEVRANPILIEIMISNLLMNAIRHNVSNGQVIVSLSNSKLVFSNTGQMYPLDSSKLFGRFAKQNPSGPGTGLGLAIVKKIADLYRWKVSYTFERGLHNFIIEF